MSMDGEFFTYLEITTLCKKLDLECWIYLQDQKYDKENCQHITDGKNGTLILSFNEFEKHYQALENTKEIKEKVKILLEKFLELKTTEKSNEVIDDKSIIQKNDNKSIIKSIEYQKLDKGIWVTNKKIKKQVFMKNNVTILLWNCRGISQKDYIKKSFLTNILHLHNIDIAILNETFLSKTEKFYIQNFKIFRSENEENRRKGVMIIVSKNIKANATVTNTDLRNGRYLKVQLIDTTTRKVDSIATYYMEPTFNEIPRLEILESDIFGGDLNNFKSGFEISERVYHLKNIKIKNIVKTGKISDHNIIIGEVKIFAEIDRNSGKINNK